jgi:threonine dehydrogenase-like Zn-dependent dehydrogenase
MPILKIGGRFTSSRRRGAEVTVQVEQGRIDPSFVITHWLELEQASEGYDIFKNKEDECIKIVLKP